MKAYTSLLLITMLFFTVSLAQTFKFKPDLWVNEQNNTLSNNKSMFAKTNDSLVNFHPTFIFNGDNDYMDIPYEGIKLNKRFTFFTVYVPTDSLKERMVWNAENSTKSIALTTKKMVGPDGASEFGGSPIRPTISTIIQYWGMTASNVKEPYLRFGNTKTFTKDIESFSGFIPEFIAFDHVLRPDDQHLVESYLAIKYGITLPSKDYVNSNRDVIWNTKLNADYSNSIAGLGRDDVFELYQKQSGSTREPNFLTMGVSEVATSNIENPSEINNLNFIVWGHNGSSFTLEKEINSSKPKVTLFQRHWLINVSGEATKELPVTAKLDIHNTVIPTGFDLALVIDRKGNGFTSKDDLDYIPLNTITEDGFALFRGIKWDTDGSGSDEFTFALIPKENFIAERFEIFPNPSNGSFNIQLELKEKTDISIRIYDSSGRIVEQWNHLGEQNIQFEGSLPGVGVFSVEVQTPEGRFSKELVIVK